MNWNIVNHNGNTGFGGCIATVESRQGRVYPLAQDLWKWEIRELESRNLLFVGATKTEAQAKEVVEAFINRSCTNPVERPVLVFRSLWLFTMIVIGLFIFYSISVGK